MAFTLDSKPDLDVPGMSESLEQKPLKDVLSWCWEMFGDRAAIGTSFQGSGLTYTP